MIKSLRGWLTTEISIDLGTANTLVYVCGQGVVLNEPSVVAVRYHDDGQHQVVAVGNDAKKMRGRTPENMKTLHPLKDGLIADFELTKQMLRHFISKIYKTVWIKSRPRIIVCIPCHVSDAEKQMIREALFLGTRAKEVYFIEEPVAAAIGAGLPIHEPTGSMIVDIGGGTTKIAVMSLEGIVVSHSLKIGGEALDQSIKDYVEQHYDCLISDAAAEQIKIEMGKAITDDGASEIPVRGRHLTHGIPVSLALNSDEIIDAMQPVLEDIVRGIYNVLQDLPPDLAADIADNGITLTGGGALIRNIDSYIELSLRTPTKIADEALTCVAQGAALILQKSNKKEHAHKYLAKELEL